MNITASRNFLLRKCVSKSEKFKKNAANELGFHSLAELARKAIISESNISRITHGMIPVTDDKVRKLIEAIKEQNYFQGWDILRCASLLADVLNYTRGNLSHLDRREAPPRISDSDVKRWHKNHVNISRKRQSSIDAQLDIIQTTEIIETTEDINQQLKFIQKFSQSWDMKHDFDHLKPT